MSAIFGLILASALTRAIPDTSPVSWTTEADYPAGAKQRREQGIVSFSLLISPEGKVVRCYVDRSSGFPELDQRTCVAISSRAQFKPAADENGRPVYDTYNGRFTWHHPDISTRPTPATTDPEQPNMELQVKQLPGGVTQQHVWLRVRVDETGHIAHCEPSRSDTNSPQIVTVACAQAKGNYATVTKNEAGTPISLIRPFHVVFNAAPL